MHTSRQALCLCCQKVHVHDHISAITHCDCPWMLVLCFTMLVVSMDQLMNCGRTATYFKNISGAVNANANAESLSAVSKIIINHDLRYWCWFLRWWYPYVHNLCEISILNRCLWTSIFTISWQPSTIEFWICSSLLPHNLQWDGRGMYDILTGWTHP